MVGRSMLRAYKETFRRGRVAWKDDHEVLPEIWTTDSAGTALERVQHSS